MRFNPWMRKGEDLQSPETTKAIGALDIESPRSKGHETEEFSTHEVPKTSGPSICGGHMS
jgi:hypothetical protein